MHTNNQKKTMQGKNHKGIQMFKKIKGNIESLTSLEKVNIRVGLEKKITRISA